jgi:UDP-N-acetylglucosamine 2-epimerase (non-hydrolysing)
MSIRVCFIVGARPNFMKAAPVIEALRALHGELEVLVIHTGQHYDRDMSEVFLDQLGLEPPDVHLGVGSGTHGDQTARALVGIEGVLLESRPSLVIVPGDVNSTLAGALAAAKLEIPVCHLEAGLRSFDRSMPEEHNRVLTDHLSALLLTHSASADANLIREGIDPDSIKLVGNTMIDSLLAHVDHARAMRPWSRLGLEPESFGLATLHRPALVDDAELLAETVEALAELGASWPVVFPVHPRTKKRLDALDLTEGLEERRVVLTAPLDYLSFLGLEAAARFVLTDSGGVQEETSALGVPCFTLRATTERPITVELGTNVVLGLDPKRIAEIPQLLEDVRGASSIPLWDGRAGSRAAAAIEAFVDVSASVSATGRSR